MNKTRRKISKARRCELTMTCLRSIAVTTKCNRRASVLFQAVRGQSSTNNHKRSGAIPKVVVANLNAALKKLP